MYNEQQKENLRIAIVLKTSKYRMQLYSLNKRQLFILFFLSIDNHTRERFIHPVTTIIRELNWHGYYFDPVLFLAHLS